MCAGLEGSHTALIVYRIRPHWEPLEPDSKPGNRKNRGCGQKESELPNGFWGVRAFLAIDLGWKTL